MIKDFTVTEASVIMNFSIRFCDSERSILKSNGFAKIIDRYLKNISKTNVELYKYFHNIGKRNTKKMLIETFKLLLVLTKEEVEKVSEDSAKFLKNKTMFIDLVEGVYNFWRSLQRYAVLQSKVRAHGIQDVNFIDGTNTFMDLVLKLYRHVIETVKEGPQNIYRQLQAGVNAGLILSDSNYQLPEEYANLANIAMIDKVILRPPFIVYPKKNTRSGIYSEIEKNPITDLKIKPSHWFGYPALIGESLAYVYFHRDFMAQGMSLCNLFKLASKEECENRKPDLIYVFGAKVDSFKENSYFNYDKKNDIYAGVAYNCPDIDYFGYMKKMLLTLHNVKMIDNGFLPIHGAMVNVTMMDGKTANVVIMGDSGAGKSESLDALRAVSSKYIKEMKVIFDDMGTLKIVNNKVTGFGTEVGAFVRLDDLEAGYAYTEMDRAIFMNPHKVNARLIIPITSYEAITKGYPVDLFLYANNYEETDKDIGIFENIEEAYDVFKKGRRKAKGTTAEIGLVESYFANPFGCVQRKEQNEKLVTKYFEGMYKDGVPVGEIYTKLAIPGFEFEGPRSAAIKLFEWIKREGK